MSFAKIKGKLSSRIGRPVHFGPPEDVKRKGGGAGAGTIIDKADPTGWQVSRSRRDRDHRARRTRGRFDLPRSG